jgi:cell division septum initiation protein DivIVA
VTEREVQALRDQVARLLSRNVELEEKIEVLQRERTELGVDEIARSLVAATRSAEQVIVDESADGRGYTIPRAEIAVRGLLSRRGDSVALRFPGAEERVGGDRLSSVSMVVAHVPAEARTPELDRLRDALERAQTAALAWDEAGGREAASAIASHATYLLALRRWVGAEAVAGIKQLADAFARFGEAVARVLPAAERSRYLAASRTFSEVAARLAAAGRASAEDLTALAEAIEELVVLLPGHRPR